LRSPRRLCCWNANSLLNRLQKDGDAFATFLTAHAPDVIFISEVRMPASGLPGCKKDDGRPRQRGELSRASPAASREADLIMAALRTHRYRAYFSLADSKYAGSALLVRRDVAQPSALRYSLDLSAPSARHHSEGRVICATFEEFDILGTYVPNNGMTDASFERRRAWDAEMSAFLRAPRERPLIWLGDLNVAAAWEDVGPNPEWFRHQNGQQAACADDRGQPGFTANEQARFSELLRDGGLVDAYRLRHPTSSWQEDVTWRGTAGAHGVPEAGRYYGKGMRIDYLLVAHNLADRVESADVLGSGNDRDGFLGSDHCPLLLQLLAAQSPAAAPQATHASEGGDAHDESVAQLAAGSDAKTGELAAKRVATG